jgi:hypothetical protein
LVGKMVYTLFESIMGNKGLEERLLKAGSKRHRKAYQSLDATSQSQQQDFSKRKYDDMAIDFTTNTPTPQESYERSRPQTPSAVRSGAASPMQPPPIQSPNSRAHATGDTFMGGTNSRPQTRPATPFNPSFSVPPTPPDLYLVTRNSPNISQSMWENFQPDQLFPDSSSMPAFPTMSPSQANQTLEQSLMTHMPPSQLPHNSMPNAASTFDFQSGHANGFLQPNAGQAFPGHPQMWQGNFDGLPDGQSPESWSTGSAPGGPAPTTLNVEDWFQFFGINGDTSNINLDMPMG